MTKPKSYYIDFELGCPYYKKGILDSEPKNDAGRNESDLICWFKGPVCKRPYRVEPREVCKHCPASFHITDGFTDTSDSSLKKYHEFTDTVYGVLQDVARANDLSRTEYGGINMQTDNKNKESVSFDDLLKSVDDFMEVLFGPRGEEADDEPKNEVDEEEKFDMWKGYRSWMSCPYVMVDEKKHRVYCSSVLSDDVLLTFDTCQECDLLSARRHNNGEDKENIEPCPYRLHESSLFDGAEYAVCKKADDVVFDTCQKCDAFVYKDPIFNKALEGIKRYANDQEAKADAGKAQLSLVPQSIIFAIARIREYGNAKYPEGGKDNWKTVEKERYVDAMLRHISAYVSDPEGVDEESGFPHLYHAATNLAFILEMEDAE